MAFRYSYYCEPECSSCIALVASRSCVFNIWFMHFKCNYTRRQRWPKAAFYNIFWICFCCLNKVFCLFVNRGNYLCQRVGKHLCRKGKRMESLISVWWLNSDRRIKLFSIVFGPRMGSVSPHWNSWQSPVVWLLLGGLAFDFQCRKMFSIVGEVTRGHKENYPNYSERGPNLQQGLASKGLGILAVESWGVQL